MNNRTGNMKPYNQGINLTALSRHALCLGQANPWGLYAKVAPVPSGTVPTGQPLRLCSQVIPALYGRSEIRDWNRNLEKDIGMNISIWAFRTL
jgi:hypothetical protein